MLRRIPIRRRRSRPAFRSLNHAFRQINRSLMGQTRCRSRRVLPRSTTQDPQRRMERVGNSAIAGPKEAVNLSSQLGNYNAVSLPSAIVHHKRIQPTRSYRGLDIRRYTGHLPTRTANRQRNHRDRSASQAHCQRLQHATRQRKRQVRPANRTIRDKPPANPVVRRQWRRRVHPNRHAANHFLHRSRSAQHRHHYRRSGAVRGMPRTPRQTS